MLCGVEPISMRGDRPRCADIPQCLRIVVDSEWHRATLLKHTQAKAAATRNIQDGQSPAWGDESRGEAVPRAVLAPQLRLWIAGEAFFSRVCGVRISPAHDDRTPSAWNN